MAATENSQQRPDESFRRYRPKHSSKSNQQQRKMACRLAVHLQFPVDPGAHGNVLDLASGLRQGPLLLGREALTRNPKCDYTSFWREEGDEAKKGGRQAAVAARARRVRLVVSVTRRVWRSKTPSSPSKQGALYGLGLGRFFKHLCPPRA